ncbi:MAG: starch-binding protein, partial [Paludibacteraceae bacterium]|nr:starch-binding protein [Paludibacteraceae bacterium]
MKKKFLLLASVLLAAFTFTANATVKITVKSTTMTPLYIYAWDDSDKAITAAWPGSLMPQAQDGTYSILYDADKVNILFHNNGGDKTADIKGITEDACFNVYADKSYKRINCTTGEDYVTPTPAVETVAVKFAVTGWEKVYAYAWYTESGSADSEEAAPKTVTLTAGWPGDEITSTLEGGFYVYNLKKGANIIFNNGTAQTQN